MPPPGGAHYRELSELIKGENLHTVCQEAACPNVGECWERGTATFMILGDTCTRRCGFCNVKTGKPTWNDPLEPRASRARSRAWACATPSSRASTATTSPTTAPRRSSASSARSASQAPECRVEVLTPDFRGEEMPLAKVIAERPDVFNHNVEAVPRLYPVARRGSRWERSLRVLRNAKEMGGDEVVTKSGLMVGLGETLDEMVDAFGQLREHDVQVLTVGQYLRPTERHLPVVRYWHPDEFKALERAAYDLGFDHIAAGPLVRSSYHADEHVPQDAARASARSPPACSCAAPAKGYREPDEGASPRPRSPPRRWPSPAAARRRPSTAARPRTGLSTRPAHHGAGRAGRRLGHDRPRDAEAIERGKLIDKGVEVYNVAGAGGTIGLAAVRRASRRRPERADGDGPGDGRRDRHQRVAGRPRATSRRSPR